MAPLTLRRSAVRGEHHLTDVTQHATSASPSYPRSPRRPNRTVVNVVSRSPQALPPAPPAPPTSRSAPGWPRRPSSLLVLSLGHDTPQHSRPSTAAGFYPGWPVFLPCSPHTPRCQT